MLLQLIVLIESYNIDIQYTGSSFLFLKFMAAIIQPHCNLSILHFKKTKSDSILIYCRAPGLHEHDSTAERTFDRSTG